MSKVLLQRLYHLYNFNFILKMMLVIPIYPEEISTKNHALLLQPRGSYEEKNTLLVFHTMNAIFLYLTNQLKIQANEKDVS